MALIKHRFTPARWMRGVIGILQLSTAAALLVGCQSPNTDGAGKVDALSSEQLVHLGDTERLAGDYPAAMRLYGRVVERGELLGPAHQGMGAALFAEGDLDGAAREYREAAAADPDNFYSFEGQARVALAQKKLGIALIEIKTAIAKGDNLPAAYNIEGIAFDYLQVHDKAQMAYRQGLQLAPDDRVLRNNLGLSLVFSHDYNQAIQILDALVHEPDATERNRQNLALALGLSGDDAKAQLVAARDLDEASVQKNMQYYDYVRSIH